MKKDIHPKNYRLVAFKDMSNDNVFITSSTVNTNNSIKKDSETKHKFKKKNTRWKFPIPLIRSIRVR